MNHFFHPKARKPVLLLAFAVLLSLAGTAASAERLPATLPTFDSPVVGPVINPDNGHYYALFVSEEISWSDALDQAIETNIKDCLGYLATVPSAEENDFLIQNFGSEIGTSGYGFWLGGYQDPGVYPAAEGWKWVTGEPWNYTNWGPGEPNDSYGPASEQHLDIQGFPDSGVGTWNDEDYLPNIRGYIIECAPWMHIQIDVKPGGWPNSINLASEGVVPVAVLTTDDFDASTVNPSSVRFAGAAPVHWAAKDVDSDDDTDLILHFKTQDLDLDEYSTEVILIGLTFDGEGIQGTDSVRLVPKSG
jgi:hypothetical protein